MRFFGKKRKVPEIKASIIPSGYSYQMFDGDKFPGGFGDTKLFMMEYWTLRERSHQLFRENVYARGLLRRLVTNEINTGLTPEVIPNAKILGIADEDELGEWAEGVEDRFSIWADTPKLCDINQQFDFGQIQRIARMEALIAGDILVVLNLDSKTGLPRVQLIGGENVITPPGYLFKSVPRIESGVELDSAGRQIAFHVQQADNTIIRIPAFGASSGRRLAWLVYGCDKRANEVRGEPLLAIILQSLKELDRYRDATQRKAAINAVLAMFIKKTQDKIGTKPITAGAVRKTSITGVDSDGLSRTYRIAQQIPGLVIEDLQVGEEPVAFGNAGIDTNFAEFEAATINAIAWANEVPPEILTLAFSSNYSASQAAINEFKNYLNKFRAEFGANFCKPIYQEWLLSEVLQQRIAAAGFLEAWRNPLKYDIFASWLWSEWSGAIKPSTDVRKQAQGYQIMLDLGLITHDRASKELTGTKFSRNIRTIKRENVALAEVRSILSPVQDLNNSGMDEEEDEENV